VDTPLRVHREARTGRVVVRDRPKRLGRRRKIRPRRGGDDIGRRHCEIDFLQARDGAGGWTLQGREDVGRRHRLGAYGTDERAGAAAHHGREDDKGDSENDMVLSNAHHGVASV
jgi:hypothetical protein